MTVLVAGATGTLGRAVAARLGGPRLLSRRPGPGGVAADRAERRPPAGVEIVLEVADVEAERERVRRAEWPIEEDITRQPWGLRDFRLLDPSGYYVRLTGR